ncbi:MAG: HypC/HybG/HupF family hydrogenase formation chaperone [Candidatus Margulisbacteria bacterium]|nr:HypC/HybG/HupF family hydrogenase formation chaperone [Candidatus Margulisiibacteriota bacterium]
MCLSIPAEIISIEEKKAVASVGGTKVNIRLDLMKKVKVGDFVLLHSGYAIEKIDPAEARETLNLIREMIE